MHQGPYSRSRRFGGDPRKLCELARMADEEHSDILGSYTGTGLDGDEPDQDADDL